MEVMEAIQNRRSIRHYLDKKIEPEKLDKVAAAFQLAPSATNAQNWRLLIVQNPVVKEKIRNITLSKAEMLTKAPAILVAVGLNQGIMTNNHRVDTVDLSIAFSYAILEANEQGLGTCWMASYKEEELRAALELEDNTSIIAISPIGYPDENPGPRPRKPLEEVIKYI